MTPQEINEAIAQNEAIQFEIGLGWCFVRFG